MKASGSFTVLCAWAALSCSSILPPYELIDSQLKTHAQTAFWATWVGWGVTLAAWLSERRKAYPKLPSVALKRTPLIAAWAIALCGIAQCWPLYFPPRYNPDPWAHTLIAATMTVVLVTPLTTLTAARRLARRASPPAQALQPLVDLLWRLSSALLAIAITAYGLMAPIINDAFTHIKFKY